MLSLPKTQIKRIYLSLPFDDGGDDSDGLLVVDYIEWNTLLYHFQKQFAITWTNLCMVVLSIHNIWITYDWRRKTQSNNFTFNDSLKFPFAFLYPTVIHTHRHCIWAWNYTQNNFVPCSLSDLLILARLTIRMHALYVCVFTLRQQTKKWTQIYIQNRWIWYKRLIG